MRDRSPVWIALCDLLLCVLAVVVAAVNPKATKGVEPKAAYIVQATWDAVGRDADVDLWMVPPPGETPVYFRNREAGLASLDHDCLGKSNTQVALADGRTVSAPYCREIITLAGVVPGRYDLALNLYSARDEQGRAIEAGPAPPVKVHVEILKTSPGVETRFEDDVTLFEIRQTVNFASFTLTADNEFALVPPPAEPVTDRFLEAKP